MAGTPGVPAILLYRRSRCLRLGVCCPLQCTASRALSSEPGPSSFGEVLPKSAAHPGMADPWTAAAGLVPHADCRSPPPSGSDFNCEGTPRGRNAHGHPVVRVGSVSTGRAHTVLDMTTPKTLLAVDGNSLLHRSFHALINSGLKTRDGRPTWAVKGFMSQLLGAIERAGAQAVVVGFDDHTHSVRKVAHPHYKATRSPKPPELGLQIGFVIELLQAAGIRVVVPTGLEADDVLASAGAFAPTVGWRTTIVTSDRDSFALIDDDTSVLRVINGGLEVSPILTPDRLHTMIGLHPSLYQQYAAMRGDASDNLAGIRGVGEKTASKLLAEFGSVQAAFDDIDDGTSAGSRVAAILGKSFVAKLGNPDSRAAFWRNVEIMEMRKDLPLGLDLAVPGAGLLPLDADRVVSALDSFELNSLRTYAGRVLCARENDSTPRPPEGFDQIPPAHEETWADPDTGETATLTQRPTAGALATAGAMRGSTAPLPTLWDDLL